MAMTFHLSQFDGPLDLLLFLIGKAKIDIRDIFVSQVTEQYIRSISEATDLDMDDASDFIAMAATLVEIKSRSLLPKQETTEEEEDPEKLLIRQLEEYQRFKSVSEEMHQLEEAAFRVFTRLPEEFPLPPPVFELTGLTLEGLMNAYADVMHRYENADREGSQDPSRKIIRDEYDVPGCIRHIQKALKKGHTIRFCELFSASPSRNEVVTLFLAVLELIRTGRIRVLQDHIYDDIRLKKCDRRKQPEQAGGLNDEA